MATKFLAAIIWGFFLSEPSQAFWESDPWPSRLKDIQVGQKLYLDLEPGRAQGIYSRPGLNYKNCNPSNDCEAKAWPQNTESLTYTGRSKIENVTPPGGTEPEAVLFLEVDYSFERTSQQKGKPKTQLFSSYGRGRAPGWIAADRIYTEPIRPVFAVNPSEALICNAQTPSFQQIANRTRHRFNQSVEDLAKDLKGLVGRCALKSPPLLPAFRTPMVYEEVLMDGLEKERWPPFKKEDGTMATTQEFIAIDAVARTLYGEMGSCHRHGLHYPLAVAAVIQRRSKNPTAYSQWRLHKKDKLPVAQVATDPWFSTWKAKTNEEEARFQKMSAHERHGEASFKHTNAEQPLCPPSSSERPFYPGRIPAPEDQDIWNDMVRIATEMVMFPEEFEKRTASIKYQDYTSAGACRPDMLPVAESPRIDGRALANKSCIEFWRARTPADRETPSVCREREKELERQRQAIKKGRGPRTAAKNADKKMRAKKASSAPQKNQRRPSKK